MLITDDTIIVQIDTTMNKFCIIVLLCPAEYNAQIAQATTYLDLGESD